MSKSARRPHARSARPEASVFTQHDAHDTARSAGHRQARLEHLLFTELQSLLTDEVADPALDDVRLVSVTLSPDAGHARLGYAVEAPLAREHEACLRTLPALARAAGFLRARLASQLDLKRCPRLSFTFLGTAGPADAGEEGGDA